MGWLLIANSVATVNPDSTREAPLMSSKDKAPVRALTQNTVSAGCQGAARASEVGVVCFPLMRTVPTGGVTAFSSLH